MSVDSIGNVDFHAHILQGADHGSRSVETSLKQLSYAELCGIKKVIATPHFYPHKHTVEGFLSRRQKAYDELGKEYSGNIDVLLGAEVLLCEGLENLGGLDALCIQGTKTLLVELPFSDFRSSYVETLRKITKRGFDVVLAHVDRYPREDIESLVDVGITRFQVNADALAGLLKPKQIVHWINLGYVIALGSDIHGDDPKAYKRYSKAKKYLNKK